MMKKVLFVVMAAAMLFSCHKEETNDCGCDVETGIPTKIYINGETGCESVKVRSTDGRINFEGGYATGAGVYDGRKRPTVEVHPNEGYEVDYFYGGPADNEKKYDYSTAGKTSFDVYLDNQDHYFKCKFKKVEKRTLTVNYDGKGSVTGSGIYNSGEVITITATPVSGYAFIGWEINSGDVTITDKNNATTTATIHKQNSVIKAIFKVIREVKVELLRGRAEYFFKTDTWPDWGSYDKAFAEELKLVSQNGITGTVTIDGYLESATVEKGSSVFYPTMFYDFPSGGEDMDTEYENKIYRWTWNIEGHTIEGPETEGCELSDIEGSILVGDIRYTITCSYGF